MSSFNQLILPLIGGYLFLSFTYYFKFYHSKLERQRLIFNSAVIGVFSLMISFIIVWLWKNLLAENFEILKTLSHFLYNLNPGISDIKGIDVIGLSFFIPIIFVFVINKIIKTDKSFEKIIDKWGDALDFVIYNSFKQEKIEDKLLLLTFKNGKVYIAFINKMTLPIEDSYINFIPVLSGYRDKDSHIVEYTTDYSKIIFDEIDDNLEELKDKLGITVRRDELLFITQFDFTILEGIEMYRGLSSKNKPKTTKSVKSTKNKMKKTEI